MDVAKQMVDYLTTGSIVNAVNVPSLDGETREKMRPLLHLAERLGKFQSSYTEGRPKELEIEYCGDLGVTDTYPITASILTGFLAPIVESVNMVSAPSLMNDHGIACSETRCPEESDYAFQIKVKVVTDDETVSISGTLFGHKDPRFCSIDDTRMDAVPEGWVLVFSNEDKPLVLGKVTTVIGESGVNIANMTLGRDERGGHATTLINLDAPLDEATLEKVRALPNMLRARQVFL